ncbi:MAG: hypothetical protein CVV42_03280 [Candidatus Riflebacteria bacterium HGW-Riflebacteria-2]|jgi:hypothetical protein|nr:MAG: hypothetical protein CVV42_03280 [Candidatus Riflebacteria bacterium HGW-Riflebacteria-2]
MNTDNDQLESEFSPLAIIAQIKTYLDAAEIRYHDIADDAIELYMQGHNLTMHVVVYVHNNHLILRIPGFIRNIEMYRSDIMQFLMQVMNDILDIRFEIGKDGKSLSACCQHILEDTMITRRQFDLAFMVLIHIVDDTYPHLMKLIYQSDSANSPEIAGDFAEAPEQNSLEEEESEETEDFAPIEDSEQTRKIN